MPPTFLAPSLVHSIIHLLVQAHQCIHYINGEVIRAHHHSFYILPFQFQGRWHGMQVPDPVISILLFNTYILKEFLNACIVYTRHLHVFFMICHLTNCLLDSEYRIQLRIFVCHVLMFIANGDTPNLVRLHMNVMSTSMPFTTIVFFLFTSTVSWLLSFLIEIGVGQ